MLVLTIFSLFKVNQERVNNILQYSQLSTPAEKSFFMTTVDQGQKQNLADKIRCKIGRLVAGKWVKTNKRHQRRTSNTFRTLQILVSPKNRHDFTLQFLHLVIVELTAYIRRAYIARFEGNLCALIN